MYLSLNTVLTKVFAFVFGKFIIFVFIFKYYAIYLDLRLMCTCTCVCVCVDKSLCVLACVYTYMNICICMCWNMWVCMADCVHWSLLNSYHDNIVIDRLIIQRLQKEYAQDIVSCLRMNNGLSRQTGVGSTFYLQLNLMKPFPLRYVQGCMYPHYTLLIKHAKKLYYRQSVCHLAS